MKRNSSLMTQLASQESASQTPNHTLSSAEDSQHRLCSSAVPSISLAQHTESHSCFYNSHRGSVANQQSSLHSGNLGTQTSIILSLGYTEFTAPRGTLRGKQEPGHSPTLSTSRWMALISSTQIPVTRTSHMVPTQAQRTLGNAPLHLSRKKNEIGLNK